MDPADFLKTADLLKAQTEQAHFRTSAGRSYYAAFLYFREHFKSLGLEKTKKRGKEEHAFVIECLQFSQVTECTQAAQHLRNLKQIREEADYHIEKSFSKNQAEDAFVIAQKVLSDYKQSMTSEKEKKLFSNASAFAKRKEWI